MLRDVFLLIVIVIAVLGIMHPIANLIEKTVKKSLNTRQVIQKIVAFLLNIPIVIGLYLFIIYILIPSYLK